MKKQLNEDGEAAPTNTIGSGAIAKPEVPLGAKLQDGKFKLDKMYEIVKRKKPNIPRNIS